jgi:shikimate dehydrogenase
VTAEAAAAAGVRVLDGLEVLVAQGAASFELWTGLAAPVGVMRKAVGLT